MSVSGAWSSHFLLISSMLAHLIKILGVRVIDYNLLLRQAHKAGEDPGRVSAQGPPTNENAKRRDTDVRRTLNRLKEPEAV